MASTITWADKSNSRNLPTIPTEQKVSASDMNTIKSVVNENSTELTSTTSQASTNAGNISTNTADIATNTADIATNTADITTNAGDISTNAGNISSNTSAITPATSNSTAISLTNRAGTVHSNSGSFMSDTTFTLAASPTELGYAFILSNAGSAPTITGATAATSFSDDYQTGSDNIILVSYINGVARYQVAFV